MSAKQTSGAAIGFTIFAATMMIVIGSMQFMLGLAAIFENEFFVVGEEYVFKFDVTTWGWIHLLIGVVMFLAGLGLFRAQTWARTVAVIVASVSAFANFLWLPYQPWWSMILIAIDIAVIWAVTVHGRDVVEP